MEKKGKILYAITKSNWGGAQKYVFDLATNFSSQYDVTVIHGGYGLLAEKLDEKKITRIPIKRLERDISILNEFGVFLNLLKIFTKEKPDIVHLNSSKIGGIGAVAARLAGIKKIIFTAHGFAFNEDRGNFSRIAIMIASYLTILASHKTIILSKKEEEQIKSWPLIKNKITLIYNGISNIEFLKKEDAQKIILKKIQEKHSPTITQETKWIGTISELTKNKGLEYAINALGDWEKNTGEKWNGIFIIIGGGEENENLQKRILQKKMEKNIFLIGFLKDASSYLKAFDIFLLSSVKEGFPFVLLEAGMAENSIISTRVGATNEIINNLENGILIHPKREKEIINAIRWLEENPEKSSLFKQKIKNKIETKFSTKQMLLSVEKICYS